MAGQGVANADSVCPGVQLRLRKGNADFHTPVHEVAAERLMVHEVHQEERHATQIRRLSSRSFGG